MTEMSQTPPETTASPSSPSEAPQTDNRYLCYRCIRCTRLITKLEMLDWRAADGGKGRPNFCSCGAGRISPTNPSDEENARYLTARNLFRFLCGRRDWSTRLWHLRLAVYASPPHEDVWQRLFGRVWSAFDGRTVLPPPPPPSKEDQEWAERAKNVLGKRIDEVADKLAREDIPLEEALVRHDTEEVAR